MSNHKDRHKFIIEIHQKGMKAAWDIARELCKMSYKEYSEIFEYGATVIDVIEKFSPLEVREKMETYKKKKKNEIKVGDIVTACDGDITFVCTKDSVDGDYSKCHLMANDGSVWENCNKSDCKRTGNTIGISDLLSKF